jgi:hypothetical protein
VFRILDFIILSARLNACDVTIFALEPGRFGWYACACDVGTFNLGP